MSLDRVLPMNTIKIPPLMHGRPNKFLWGGGGGKSKKGPPPPHKDKSLSNQIEKKVAKRSPQREKK